VAEAPLRIFIAALDATHDPVRNLQKMGQFQALASEIRSGGYQPVPSLQK